MDGDAVEVYRARDSRIAHQVVAMLKAHSIPAAVVGEDLEGVAVGIQFVPDLQPRIWVPRSLAERARALIREMDEQPEGGDDGPWTCPTCGSEVDEGFDVCWSCETVRPGDAG